MARRKKQGSHGYSLLLKDSVIYGAGRALQKFLVALLLPLYTAFLTQADYGILGMVVTVTTFLDVFVTLGFDVAFSRFYFDDKSETARRRVITNVFYVSTLYPLILLGTVGVLLPRLVPLLLGKEYDPGDWRYFAVALATLFFSNLNDLPFTLFRLEHRPWIFTGYTIGRIFVQVPLSIVFVAVFGWGPMGVLLANLFTAAGMQVGLLPTYIRKVDWRWHWHLMRPMLAFAVPALFTGVSFYWLKLSDRYFLLHYQSKAVVGLYTVAYSLSQPLYLTLMAFRMAWPQWHYAKLHQPEKHRKMVSRSSTYFFALNAVMLVLIGAFMPFIVHTFLNEKFWSIGPTTFVLALSVTVYAVYFVFWVGSNVAKKNRMIPVFFLIASAANVALNFVFVPKYGMYAAAWTTVAGFAILAVTIYFYSEKWYPIPYEWARLLKIVLAATLTLGAAWGMGWALGQDVFMPYDQLVLTTLAQVPTLLLFPLVLFATRFFTDGERTRLAHALGRRRGRRGLGLRRRGDGGRPDDAAERRRRSRRGRRARDGEGRRCRLHRGSLDHDHHMNAAAHKRLVRRSGGARRTRRRATVCFALAVLALSAAGCARPVAGEPEAAAGAAASGAAAQPAKPPFVLTDRTVKLRLLRQATEPPRILIFGGSRATRIEPAYFRRLTGRTAFNLAFQNGRPEDAWAFVNHLRRTRPGKPLQIVWFIHVEAFRKQGLSAGIVQEKRLSRWFPPALIRAEKKKLPQTQAEVPAGKDLARTRYGADGAVLRNRYDLAEARGRPRSRAIDHSIATALERYATTTAALYPRSQRYFEKTVALLDEMGTSQVVVLAPLHPRLLAAVRGAGWSERHAEVMAYLRRVQKRHDFRLLDYSELATIDGDPGDFYDGFHFKRANARRLIRAVVGAFPEAFGIESAEDQ